MRKTGIVQESNRAWFAAVFMFMGHMAGAAIAFLALSTITWGLGFFLHQLDTAHRFEPPVLLILQGLEYLFLAIDVSVVTFLVGFGSIRLVKEIWKGHS